MDGAGKTGARGMSDKLVDNKPPLHLDCDWQPLPGQNNAPKSDCSQSTDSKEYFCGVCKSSGEPPNRCVASRWGSCEILPCTSSFLSSADYPAYDDGLSWIMCDACKMV